MSGEVVICHFIYLFFFLKNSLFIYLFTFILGLMSALVKQEQLIFSLSNYIVRASTIVVLKAKKLFLAPPYKCTTIVVL